jgi:ribosomal protein S18 acetylase RimI-like enzyme
MATNYDTLVIRYATADDATVIGRHRRDMFEDMGYRDEAIINEMVANFRVWVREKLESGEYIGWLMEDDRGDVVAGAGLWLMDWPPHILSVHGRRAYILNVYVDPGYRRQGLARHMMKLILVWCKEHEIPTVALHASDEGRSLYESLKFMASNEMKIQLST